MKKTTKALYAAAAGLALLATTGGGTYALWRDGVNLGAADAQIQTGNLALDFAAPADQNNAPCGLAPEGKKICWTMTPPTGAAKSSYDFSTLPHVAEGYRLTGTTRILGTLEGSTIVANLQKPVINYGVDAAPELDTPANHQKLIDLKQWLSESKTTITIKNDAGTTMAGRDSQGNSSVTSPVALTSTGKYTLEVPVQFPTRDLPDRSGVPLQAYMYLGNIDLELVQITSGTPFRG